MTCILPGDLAVFDSTGYSGWDPLTFGWGPSGPGLLSAPAPGTLGGPSVAPLLAPTSITETFGTVENPLSHGGQWQHKTVYWANMAVGTFNLPGPTNVCYGLQTGANLYGDAYAYLSPLVWPPSHTDYTVAATINRNNVLGPGGEADEYECVLRVTDSAAPTGTGAVTLYECNYQIDGAYAQFVAWDGAPGTFSIIYPGPGTQPALVTGDVIAATIQGQTVTFKRNGATLFTQTAPVAGSIDANYTGPFPTGQPGIAKFYQATGAGTGPGDHFGFTQVVITSSPYTAPVPQTLITTTASTSPSGTIVGQIPCQHNPTSWSISGATPPEGATYFTIDSFANVVVQAAAVGNLTSPSYVFTATATNSFGSNTASVRVSITGGTVTGPQFSNSNHTVIDGDNSHGRPLGVRALKRVESTGTAPSLRRYVEFQVGNSPTERPPGLGFVSVGGVTNSWNPAGSTQLPLGFDTTGYSVGLVANQSFLQYFIMFAGASQGSFSGLVTGGDIIGMAVDNSGVNFPSKSCFWFSVNGHYLNGTTTFPGLATPDWLVPFLLPIWPACTTDYVDHVTINPSPRQLYKPAGFLALG